MNGADVVVKFMKNKNVEYVFGYPGGPVLHLYDAVYRHDLNHILTRHEQGAVHAAEGYAKATGKIGVCFATSGPGATNLVTGLADAMLDSVPLMAVTGQVATAFIGHDAFQEADILGITMPITKNNYLVRKKEMLLEILNDAWDTAIEGRPGPVLVDIPKDVLMAHFDDDMDFNPPKKHFEKVKSTKYDIADQLPAITEALRTAHRPMILAGGGVTLSKGAGQLVSDFAKKTGIPVGITLMGKGALVPGDAASLGMCGMHGSAFANMALSKCDLLIAVGSRFSDRTIGNARTYAKGRFIIHADIDAAEISKNMEVNIPVVADAAEFMKAMQTINFEEKKIEEWNAWNEEVQVAKHGINVSFQTSGPLKPQEIIQAVARAVPDAIVVTDVGQHQMFAAQHFPICKNRSFITSGGLGTMGFGLPASIGTALGRPGEDVILFTGDGSIQMNIQELATLRRLSPNVKVFLIDNGCLGMVRQWQQQFYESRYSQINLDDNPDFIGIAKAYGLLAFDITEREGLDEKIREIIDISGPVIIHCKVAEMENVYPLIPPGKGPSDMVGVKE
ncbi:biosynthetic-type acetolactate synthase large subunit [bacterium]|nr:MAG: biosynthetic-type acetolactate synthase large subunit [bacterium]